MDRSIRVKTIDLVIFSLFIAVFKIRLIPQVIQQITKIFLLLFVVLFLNKKIKFKCYMNFIFLMSLFMIVSSVSGYVDRTTKLINIANSILYVICINCIWLVCKYCKEKNCLQLLIRDLFYIDSIYCVLSLISMFVFGHSANGTEIMYIFGSKFMTSYYFIFWITLFRIRNQEKIDNNGIYKFYYFLLVILVLYICKWLYCTTAMVATLFLFIEQFIPKRLKVILFNRASIITSVLLAGMIPICINTVLANKNVQHIIVDILHKSSNITGRKVVFVNLIGNVIKKRPWFGYGYGNSAVHQLINENIDNAQNGLMEQIVNYGVIGGILFCIMIFMSMPSAYKGNKQNALYTALYVMIICSIVEISYNFIFYFIIILIANFNDNSNRVYGNKI